MFYVENSRIIPQFLSLKKQLVDKSHTDFDSR